MPIRKFPTNTVGLRSGVSRLSHDGGCSKIRVFPIDLEQRLSWNAP
jgi:hypothetical protein